MKKLEKINKVLYTIIFGTFTLLIFIMHITQQNISFYEEYTNTYKFFKEMSLSIKQFDVMYLSLGIFIYYAYYNIYFDGQKLGKKSFINSIIAILITFITIIGKSYNMDNTLGIIFNTPAQTVKCILLGIGYYFMYYAIIKKVSSINFDNFIEKNITNKKKNPRLEKIKKIISDYQILISLTIILLGWLPYIILYFPGASTGDTFDSLMQFFHQDNSWSIKTIDLLSEKVYINKHHPPFFTVILGLVFKLGKYFGSFTIGAFIYTILQISLLLIVFGFMLRYMKNHNVPLWIRNASTLFISLTPSIAAYAISAIKDTPSAIFTTLYTIFLLQIVKNYNSIFKSKIRTLVLIIVIMLVLLLRNNGIYTIMLSFPFLIILYKNKWKKLALILVVCLSIFGIYDKVLLPKLNVTDGSIKEVLTIPFMQVARLAHFYPDAITKEDQKIISKVMDYEGIKLYYEPDLADSVKDRYKKDCTKEELKDYFKVWFKYLKKHPKVYIESLINSTYGYFFPEAGEPFAYLAVDSRVGPDTYINISPIVGFKENRETIVMYNEILAKIPFTSLFLHVAFYDWFLIFSCLYIIIQKKYKYLIPMLPLLSVLLVCLASPINGSFRYILPIVFSIPVILLIDYFVYIESKNKKIIKNM